MNPLQKLFTLLILSVITTKSIWAIPPPDFIISGLQSMIQLVGVVIAFFISVFFLAKDWLKNIWTTHRKKCLLFLFILIVILLLLVFFIINT